MSKNQSLNYLDFGIDLQSYIKIHKLENKTKKELFEFISNDVKINNCLKRVWIRDIQCLHSKFCKNCGKSIPDFLSFCSKNCIESYNNKVQGEK